MCGSAALATDGEGKINGSEVNTIKVSAVTKYSDHSLSHHLLGPLLPYHQSHLAFSNHFTKIHDIMSLR